MLNFNNSETHEFLQELSKCQARWAELIHKKYPTDVNEFIESLKTSRYFLCNMPIKRFSKSTLRKILTEIVDLLAKYKPKLSKDALPLVANFDQVYKILAKGSEGDLVEWTTQQQLSPLVVGQIIDWSLRPKKMALGKIVQPLLDDKSNSNLHWDNSFCPICGEQSDIAILSKPNGERHLACSCCQLTWVYPRLQCLSCKNTDPHGLKYYFVEDAPEQQIHYCEACSSYIKTIDYRLSNEKVEDLKSLDYIMAHLDIIAEQQGLARTALD